MVFILLLFCNDKILEYNKSDVGNWGFEGRMLIYLAIPSLGVFSSIFSVEGHYTFHQNVISKARVGEGFTLSWDIVLLQYLEILVS